MPTPPTPRPVALRIELEEVSPLIWRRVIVPNHWAFASLHRYLQWVMGWQDSHAHEFQVGERVAAPEWWIQELADSGSTAHCVDERRLSVGAVANELGVAGVFAYRYDMGDGWEHRIIVEAPPVAWVQHELALPVCTAGENACPPEDVGGPHGYEHFLASLGDTRNQEHVDMLRWIGGIFDPKGFDLNRINRDWRGSKRAR